MARSIVRGRRVTTGESASTSSVEKVDISDIVKAIRKDHGERAVMMASNKRQPSRIPTGVFAIDLAGLGGIPECCIVEFKGAKHSGKTTTALKVVAQAQRKYPDRTVAFIDVEHAFDPVWAEKNGVNVEELLLVQPVGGEEAVDQAQGLMAHPGISLVVMDSIAALVPMKEIDDAAEQAQVGIHAKLVTKLVRKVLHGISTQAKEGNAVTFLCINQQRSKIGGWAPPGQEPISDPGGKALGHYTMFEIKFKNKENMKKEDGIEMLDFNEHAFTIEKNKWNAGIRKGEFQLRRQSHDEYGLIEGDVDDAAAMLAYAKKIGIYTGGGRAWTLELPEFEDTKGSADEWIKFLYENRDVYNQTRNHLIALHAVNLGMPQYLIDGVYEQELAHRE